MRLAKTTKSFLDGLSSENNVAESRPCREKKMDYITFHKYFRAPRNNARKSMASLAELAESSQSSLGTRGCNASDSGVAGILDSSHMMKRFCAGGGGRTGIEMKVQPRMLVQAPRRMNLFPTAHLPNTPAHMFC